MNYDKLNEQIAEIITERAALRIERNQLRHALERAVVYAVHGDGAACPANLHHENWRHPEGCEKACLIIDTANPHACWLQYFMFRNINGSLTEATMKTKEEPKHSTVANGAMDILRKGELR